MPNALCCFAWVTSCCCVCVVMELAVAYEIKATCHARCSLLRCSREPLAIPHMTTTNFNSFCKRGHSSWPCTTCACTEASFFMPNALYHFAFVSRLLHLFHQKFLTYVANVVHASLDVLLWSGETFCCTSFSGHYICHCDHSHVEPFSAMLHVLFSPLIGRGACTSGMMSMHELWQTCVAGLYTICDKAALSQGWQLVMVCICDAT